MRKWVLVFIAYWFSISYMAEATIKTNTEKTFEVIWERLITAITYVESRNDDKAYNKKSGALGRFQMKRIYVDDVNRILKMKKIKRKYSYEDRKNHKKAREMFDIIQNHYNPEKDIDKAIVLHRGKVSKRYIKEIKAHM